MSQITFDDALQKLTDEEGSDLYYSTGAPPSAKLFGTLTPFSDEIMKPGEIEEIANSIMSEGFNCHINILKKFFIVFLVNIPPKIHSKLTIRD